MIQFITLAIRVVTIVLKVSPQKILKGKLFKTLSKYGGASFTQQISSASQVAKIAADPNKLMSILRKASQTEIKEILKELEQFEKGNFKTKIKEITNDIKQSKSIAKSENKNLKDLEQEIKGNFNKNQDRKYLSSSWLKYGEYHQLGNTGLGNLTIKILQDGETKWYGPYVYPAVPKLVWDNMKLAKGKNGTGAGSVFWKMFLGHWLPSNLRDYVDKHKSQFLDKDLKKVNESIHKLSNNYYNKKSVKANRNSNLLDNKKYQQHYRDSLKQVRTIAESNKDKNKTTLQVLRDEKKYFNESRKPHIERVKANKFNSFNVIRKTDFIVASNKKIVNKKINKIKKGKTITTIKKIKKAF